MRNGILKAFMLLTVCIMFFAFVSCDEGPMEIRIVEDQSSNQYDEDVTGKTFICTPELNYITKTTVTGNEDANQTFVEEKILLSQDSVVFTLSELSGNEGTFTYSRSSSFLPAVDVAYTSTVDVYYSIADMDCNGYSGLEFYTLDAAGTYGVYEDEIGRDYYVFTLTSLVTETLLDRDGNPVESNYATYPVYDAAQTTTRTEIAHLGENNSGTTYSLSGTQIDIRETEDVSYYFDYLYLDINGFDHGNDFGGTWNYDYAYMQEQE